MEKCIPIHIPSRCPLHEHAMKALTAENRAKVVLAEAEVPLAVADAYRMGRLRAAATTSAT
jgi:uncharacterized protein YqfA (UPF0365 family)